MTDLPRNQPEDEWEIASTVWDDGDAGPLHVSILFIDLVGSTDLAGVMGLEEYAAFSASFHQTCREQCSYFFRKRRKKFGRRGIRYQIELIGDELVVYLNTSRNHDDVYQLIRLAIALKCAWLGVPLNAERVASGRPTIEISAGIHSGPLWATRTGNHFVRTGFAINLAKRIESASRQGEHFRILVSDPAFKLINRRMRNLIFGPRTLQPMKGLSASIGAYEVVDSFVDPRSVLTPHYFKAFVEVGMRALATNTFDLWIHSCIQVAAARDGFVTDEAVGLCRQVLNIDPKNAAALFYSSEAESERGNLESARLFLEDLIRWWPRVGDGWLALGRLLKQMGESQEARRCLLQARRYGVGEAEEELPAEPGA